MFAMLMICYAMRELDAIITPRRRCRAAMLFSTPPPSRAMPRKIFIDAAEMLSPGA